MNSQLVMELDFKVPTLKIYKLVGLLHLVDHGEKLIEVSTGSLNVRINRVLMHLNKLCASLSRIHKVRTALK